jgi:4-amino-4-deoxy-L-arabinose transferase-like glycosyltransferase
MKKINVRWVLIAILLIGLFFRVWKLESFYIFEHDQDLYSWIVKDIWVEHHLRTIGQVTSIEGVFVGPLFYYLLVPFYVIGGMNPVAATWFATLIGLLTIYSVFFVFKKNFSTGVGLFGAAIYATSLGPVFFDRWVVPTQLTMIWCVWLLYTAFALAQGKKHALILVAILVGTIWHIHIALLPLLPLLFFAFLLNKQNYKNLIKIKTFVTCLGIFLVLTLPFWIFEYKHNFLQTKSLLFNSGGGGEILMGLKRWLKIMDALQKVLTTAVFDSWNLPQILVPVLSIFLFIFSFWKKILNNKQTLILGFWVLLVLITQQIIKNPISEYYFANLTIIPILLLSLVLNYFWHRKLKYLILVLFVAYIAINTFLLVTKPEPLHLYTYKKKTVDYIQQDFKKNNYQCISVNFIAKYGTAVGFRYPIWWEGMHQVQPNPKVPSYTIVIPYDAINKDELNAQFGYFGVILPKGGNYDFSICNDPKLELIPLLGFTN